MLLPGPQLTPQPVGTGEASLIMPGTTAQQFAPAQFSPPRKYAAHTSRNEADIFTHASQRAGHGFSGLAAGAAQPCTHQDAPAAPAPLLAARPQL